MVDFLKKLSIFFTVSFLLHVNAQELKLGPCPEVKPMEDFDVNKFTLRWYEFGKTPVEGTPYKTCTEHQHLPTMNSIWPVVHYIVDGNGTQYNYTTNSYIYGIGVGLSSLDGNRYTYLGTDYLTYASVITCKEVDMNMHNETLYILTSSRNPAPDTIKTALEVFEDNGINYLEIRSTNLCGCPENGNNTVTE